jgi:hypothetical protein
LRARQHPAQEAVVRQLDRMRHRCAKAQQTTGFPTPAEVSPPRAFATRRARMKGIAGVALETRNEGRKSSSESFVAAENPLHRVRRIGFRRREQVAVRVAGDSDR